MNINQIWAQAYRLFQEGIIYWLEKEDQEELSEYNEQFEVQSDEYEILVTYLQPLAADSTAEAYLTNAEIKSHLEEKVMIKLSSKKIGEALRKAGFVRVQKRRNNLRTWVYGVIHADEADIYMGRQPDPPGSSKEETNEHNF